MGIRTNKQPEKGSKPFPLYLMLCSFGLSSIVTWIWHMRKAVLGHPWCSHSFIPLIRLLYDPQKLIRQTGFTAIFSILYFSPSEQKKKENGGLRKSSSKKEKGKAATLQAPEKEMKAQKKAESSKSSTLGRLFRPKVCIRRVLPEDLTVTAWQLLQLLGSSWLNSQKLPSVIEGICVHPPNHLRSSTHPSLRATNMLTRDAMYVDQRTN